MKATARKSEPVHPSSRDPVGGWLDVFIPMLGLPRDRAEEIRAELEDHLRARVDDLMITGKSETEATQQAVAELGETAELARDFRSALKPRRRMLMQTALITAVGASVFFGILTFTGAPPAPPHAPAPAVAGERVELEDALASDFIPDITINTRNMTYADLFNTMRENMDRPFLVHWDRLRPVGMSPEGTLGLGGDELPLRRVLMLLEERTQFNNGDQIAFLLEHDLVEVSTRSHFDHRTMETLRYDIRDLLELRTGLHAGDHDQHATRDWEDAGRSVLETLSSLCERDGWFENGGELVSGRLVGGSLLIQAPTRIHKQIEYVLGMLHADAEETRRQADEAAQRAERERAEEIADLVDQLEQLKRDIQDLTVRSEQLRLTGDNAKDRLLKSQRTLGIMRQVGQEKFAELNLNESLAGMSLPELQDYIKRARAEHAETVAEQTSVRLELDDKSAYRDAIRARLIELKYPPVLHSTQGRGRGDGLIIRAPSRMDSQNGN